MTVIMVHVVIIVAIKTCQKWSIPEFTRFVSYAKVGFFMMKSDKNTFDCKNMEKFIWKFNHYLLMGESKPAFRLRLELSSHTR